MEIIEKSSLKTKLLVIILIIITMLGVSAFLHTVKANNEEFEKSLKEIIEKYKDVGGADATKVDNGEQFDLNKDGIIDEKDLELLQEQPEEQPEEEQPEEEQPEEEQPEEEPTQKETPKLNTKIEFTGKTYKFPNNDKVRKQYEEDEVGTGIVGIVSKTAKHSVYVIGEGWIDLEQIVQGKTVKFIDLKLENIKDGQIDFTINGEYVYVESTNTAVLDYQDGKLTLAGSGQTDVVLTTKEGKKINALATVIEGGLELNIPEQQISGVIDADATIAEKVKIEAEAGAGLSLDISEDGVITVEGAIAGLSEGNPDAQIKVTVDESEIVDVKGNATGNITANTAEKRIDVEGKAKQVITLFQKLKMVLNENMGATVSDKNAGVAVGGDVAVDDQEVAAGGAILEYEYGAEDPKGTAYLNVLGENVVNVEERTIPVFSLFKKIINRIRGV